jgi:hypothetical protein
MLACWKKLLGSSFGRALMSSRALLYFAKLSSLTKCAAGLTLNFSKL